MKQELTTIIIPFFNRSRYLRKCVLSVLEEAKVTPIETLLIDDASTDNSYESIKDLPVCVLRNTHQSGPAFSRNKGIRAAQGTWITFLDSDDLLAPGSITKRLDWLKHNPMEPVVGGRLAGTIDEDGKSLPRTRPLPPEILNLEWVKKGKATDCSLWFYLFHRDVFSKVGYLNEEYSSADDCDFMLRVLQEYSVPILSIPTVFHRLHADNLTTKYVANTYIEPNRTKAERLFAGLSHGLSFL